jgi:predicted TIM-barrel fold metal-dependent hydrolase
MKILAMALPLIAVLVLAAAFSGPVKESGDPQNLKSTLLLSKYRPESIYRIPQTHITKAKYPVIDMHSHPYARSAREIEQWVKTMQDKGITKTVILTAATGSEFDSTYALYAGRYPDKFEVWCGFDYTGYDQAGFGPNAVAELERCVRAGARGVGELGDKGKGLFYSHPGPKAWGMHPDDPRMDALLEKCAELHLPVNIHIADPIWMYQKMDSTNDGLMNAYTWRLDNQPGILNHSQMIDVLERTLQRHPNTTIIACHFANLDYDLNRLGQLLDKYPNLWADIAARYAETAPIPRFVKKFYEKYQDRLLYGTDMGFAPEMYDITFRILESEDEHFYEIGLFNYHWALNGLALDDDVLKKIYADNARRVH